MKPLIFDNHSHSEHSFDAEGKVHDICLCAIEKGVSGFSITDHCEIGKYHCDTADWQPQLAALQSDIIEARELFGDRLKISFGLELGEPMHDETMAQKVASAFDYDVIIGSIHNIRDTEDFYYLAQRDRGTIDVKNIIERYFLEQLELSRRGGYDIHSHLTYAYRYLGHGNGVPEPKQYEDVLRELFANLIQKGIALEVNTSGKLKTPPSELLPTLWEMKLYKECGGELVTIGSDSHKPETIAGGNAEGREMLLAAGFKYQAFYQNRKAQMYKL